MSLTSTHYFIADHRSDAAPSDPNLFSASDIVTFAGIDSAAISVATSKGVSSITAAAPDSTNLSIADSRGVSSGTRASVADSKAVSAAAVVPLRADLTDGFNTGFLAPAKGLAIPNNLTVAALTAAGTSVIALIGLDTANNIRITPLSNGPTFVGSVDSDTGMAAGDFGVEGHIRVGKVAGAPGIYFCTGVPAIVANKGSIALRNDGGTGTTLYVKESGDGSASGWVAK
jgi:hypothetical protein